MRNNKEEQVAGRIRKTMPQTGGTVYSDSEAEELGFPWGWSSGKGEGGRQVGSPVSGFAGQPSASCSYCVRDSWRACKREMK